MYSLLQQYTLCYRLTMSGKRRRSNRERRLRVWVRGGAGRERRDAAMNRLLLVFLTLPFCAALKYSTRVVRTKYGPLRGVIVQHPPVEAFLGVPYATPPLGALRYMPPVTPSMWRTPRLADSFSAVCPQKAPQIENHTEALLEFPRGRLAYLERLLPLLTNQSEDCLYLNIYVPRSGKHCTVPCFKIF